MDQRAGRASSVARPVAFCVLTLRRSRVRSVPPAVRSAPSRTRTHVLQRDSIAARRAIGVCVSALTLRRRDVAETRLRESAPPPSSNLLLSSSAQLNHGCETRARRHGTPLGEDEEELSLRRWPVSGASHIEGPRHAFKLRALFSICNGAPPRTRAASLQLAFVDPRARHRDAEHLYVSAQVARTQQTDGCAVP